jgi:hypothetical protein
MPVRETRGAGRLAARLAALAVGAALLGCADEPRTTLTSPPNAPAQASTVTLTLSDSALQPGTTVAVRGSVRVASGLAAVGAYKATLHYDAARLTYVDATPLDGGLRVANGHQAGTVVVAGAAATGFTDGTLFELRFRVGDPQGLRTIELSVDELAGADYRDELSSVPARTAIHVTPR